MQAYTYDATGNRLSRKDQGSDVAFSYPLDSHRLIQVGDAKRSYDVTGNLTGDERAADCNTPTTAVAA